MKIYEKDKMENLLKVVSKWEHEDAWEQYFWIFKYFIGIIYDIFLFYFTLNFNIKYSI